MVEQEKLPPGWKWVNAPGSVVRVAQDARGHEFGAEDAAAVLRWAWRKWSKESGITREKWEAMERAVDFVRYYREMFDLVPEGEWPALANDADAILAALEGE